MNRARLNWPLLALLFSPVAYLPGCFGPSSGLRWDDPDRPVWRAGWASLREPEKLIACARELRFNALIVHADPQRMKEFSELTKRNGIECYYWFSLVARGEQHKALRQVMSRAEERRLAELAADKDPRKHGYQFGGEPLPGRREVLQTRLLCFHRPEVVAYCKKHLSEMLEACPALTGIAFDYFGYQNYRCCLCPYSQERLRIYHDAHRAFSDEGARNQFALESLVAFTNEMADHVRAVRPSAKVAVHVYPVFAPEPLYGNRLDVDYCCQTVAWFFEPYWPAEKVARCARTVVREQNRYWRRQQGIPFVGVYAQRAVADKSPERLAEELRTIKRHARTYSLSVCSFDEFIRHPKLRRVMKKALR
jgi:hypothetical protein